MVNTERVQRHKALAADAIEVAEAFSEAYRSAIVTGLLIGDLFRPVELPLAGGGHVAGATPRPATQQPEPSLAEQFTGIGRISQPEQILVIAADMFRRRGEGVSREEILAAYRGMRLPAPANLSEQISRAIRRGWIRDDGRREGAKTWSVTSTGLSRADALRTQGGGT